MDLTLYDSDKPIPKSFPMTWVGDAYELRDELNDVISELERKKKRRGS